MFTEVIEPVRSILFSALVLASATAHAAPLSFALEGGRLSLLPSLSLARLDEAPAPAPWLTDGQARAVPSEVDSPGPGWLIAAMSGAVICGAEAGLAGGTALAASVDNNGNSNTSQTVALLTGGAVLGSLAAGVGGYFLGRAARDGSLIARISTVALDVIAPVGIAAVGIAVLLASSPSED